MDAAPPLTATQTVPPPAEPAAIVVPARVEPILADLAETRGIFLKFLRRAEEVVAAMPAERQAEALTEGGHLMLGLTRLGRAIRQVAVLEMEIMGLREPAAPRGHGLGGGPRADGRQESDDAADLKDLNDLDDLYDLNDPADLEEYRDLESLERYESFAEYERHRRYDAELRRQMDEALTARLEAELAELPDEETSSADLPPEEKRRRVQAMDEELKALMAADAEKAEARWRARREALFRRRAAEKRIKRRGRGPPLG